MRYFELNSNHFEKWVQFPDKADIARLQKLDTTTIEDIFDQAALKIDWIEDPEGGKKWLDLHTCSPTFSVISINAVECLNEFLEPNGFSIRTKGLNDNYLVYNITTVLNNAFDWEVSKVKGNRDHLSEINTAAIFRNKIEGIHIFKLEESRVDIFVSEEFKKEVEKSELSGFLFKEVILV